MALRIDDEDDATHRPHSRSRSATRAPYRPSNVSAPLCSPPAAIASGAAAGAVLARRWVFTEETNAAAAFAGIVGAQLVRPEGADVIVPQDTGLRVVQGAVASVGNIGFEVTFALI